MNIGMQKELISNEFSKILKRNLGTQSLSQPDLNGALFVGLQKSWLLLGIAMPQKSGNGGRIKLPK